jgi:hypothetical protein
LATLLIRLDLQGTETETEGAEERFAGLKLNNRALVKSFLKRYSNCKTGFLKERLFKK